MAASFDASELDSLARDLTKAGTIAAEKVKPVISKGALAIKTQMVAEMRSSRHFKGTASSITYDIKESAGGVEAQIGPKSGPGSPGALANIAYFGSSRGGGSVADPQGALDAEAPLFQMAFEKLVGEVIG